MGRGFDDTFRDTFAVVGHHRDAVFRSDSDRDTAEHPRIAQSHHAQQPDNRPAYFSVGGVECNQGALERLLVELRLLPGVLGDSEVRHILADKCRDDIGYYNGTERSGKWLIE